MIDSQLHPLDEVQLFGHTIHGLIRGVVSARVYEVDGVAFPLPASYNLGLATQQVAQIVRKPGIAEVPLAPEVLEAERAQGRVWQNYAMLRGNLSLFGKQLGGWIYFDSAGDRWLIRPESLPSLTVGGSYTATFSIRPFGYLDDEPVTPREVTLVLANTQQSTSPGTSRFVAVETVRSDGGQALLRLSLNGYTAGYLAVGVTGDGDEIALSLSVLRSEAQTLGSWTNNTADLNLTTSAVYRLLATTSPEGLTPAYEFPPEGATVTWEPDGLLRIDNSNQAGAAASIIQASYTAGRTDRLVALVYDDTDQLVEFTYDTTYVLDLDYPDFDVEVSGSASITATSGGLNQATTGAINITMTRNVTNRAAVIVSLRRDGVLVASDEGEVIYTGTQVFDGSFESPGFTYYPESGQWRMQQYPTTWTSQLGAESLDVPPPFAVSATSSEGSSIAPVNRFWGVNNIFPSSGERDAYGVSAFLQITNSSFEVVREEWDCDGRNGGAVFSRLHRVGTPTTRYELAMAYTHAELLARGVAPPETAYNPVTHEIAVDNTDGPVVGFV